MRTRVQNTKRRLRRARLAALRFAGDKRARLAATAARRKARAWQQLYRARFVVVSHWLQHERRGKPLLLGIAIAGTVLAIPYARTALDNYFADTERFPALRSLLQTISGALIGAAAIASSLVLFALQVNVERMPYGLFRRLSSDLRLLVAFGATFVLAVGVAVLSLVPDKAWATETIVGSAWAVILVLILFLYGYKRALKLVSPSAQLAMVVDGAQRSLRIWSKRAERAAPLLADVQVLKPSTGVAELKLDLRRWSYFQINKDWMADALSALQHAISFARIHSEKGDYEISRLAFAAIIAINSAYINSKGKTFFPTNPFTDTPHSTDAFVNATLEHIRLFARAAASRRDEQQLEQALRAFSDLAGLYFTIDYGNQFSGKHHAHLAAGYLSSEVEATIPHDMPDVLMEGARLLGRTELMFLQRGRTEEFGTLTEKLGLLGSIGAAKESYRPVTLIAMEQLAMLSFALLQTTHMEVKFAANKIREEVHQVVEFSLKVPESPLHRNHQTFLAPYYSGTSYSSLRQYVRNLVNAVLDAPADSGEAKQVLQNLAKWAEDMYRTDKEVLLLCVKQKSSLTLDVISWISGITEFLLAASNAPACTEHTRQKLRDDATWLAAVLTWVPDEKVAVEFAEHSRMTETVFDIGVAAHERGCPKLLDETIMHLLSWGLKGGHHETGWSTLERAIYGTVTLALLAGGDAPDRLKVQLAAQLSKDSGLKTHVRRQTARDIRTRAESLYRSGHWSSQIEHAMTSLDHQQVGEMLHEMANLLSPDTKDEPVDIRFL